MPTPATSEISEADDRPSQDVRIIPTASLTAGLPNSQPPIADASMAPMSTRSNPEHEPAEDDLRRQKSF